MFQIFNIDNQKLNITKCILKNPKLILIDSIFSFLNKHEKLKIFSVIKKYQLELISKLFTGSENINIESAFVYQVNAKLEEFVLYVPESDNSTKFTIGSCVTTKL